jgi:hypothetical protein
MSRANAVSDKGPFRRINKALPAITANETLEYLIKCMALSFSARGQELI